MNTERETQLCRDKYPFVSKHNGQLVLTIVCITVSNFPRQLYSMQTPSLHQRREDVINKLPVISVTPLLQELQTDY